MFEQKHYQHDLPCLSSHLSSAGTITQISPFCLVITLWCLHSMTLLIKSWHSFIILLCPNLSSSWWTIEFLSYMYISKELLIDLIRSFSNFLSVFLIISRPLIVLMLVLSLILTGMTSLFRHLNENLLWFRKSAIFFSIFSHCRKRKTLSSPNSSFNWKCRFLILFANNYEFQISINRTDFVTKHKLSPVNLTWLSQVYGKMFFFPIG